ncbi:MAG: hypothetical protein ACRDIB_09395, partial [Ardenticatenaceae bacterium]
MLGSCLNGVTPTDLVERGFGAVGVLYRCPPRGEWLDCGEESLADYLRPALARKLRLSWHYPVLYLPLDGRHPMQPDWFSRDPCRRRAERQRFDLDVAAAARLGADHVVSHFTSYPSLQPADEIDAALV